MSERPIDTGDESQVKARKRKLTFAQREREKALLTVMGTKEGRSVLWGLWSDAGVNRVSFVPGDPHATSFNEGARNLGNKLLAEVLDLCPDLYLATQKEANAKKEEDKND